MQTYRKAGMILAFILPVTLQAQFLPIAKDSSYWYEYMERYDSPWTTYYYYTILTFHGDTIINDTSYSSLWLTSSPSGPANSPAYFVREDSLGRVYCYWQFTGNGRDELLYDFSLEAGDSLFIVNYCIFPDYGKWIVMETDSIFIANAWRKRMKMKSDTYFGTTYWIEGIGDIKGMFSPTLCAFENWHCLTCYEEQQARWPNPLLAWHPYFCGDNIGLNEFHENSSVDLAPNPADDRLEIVWNGMPFTNDPVSISIYNLIGQHVTELHVEFWESPYTLDLNQFNNGIYLLQIYCGPKVISSKRFVVAH